MSSDAAAALSRPVADPVVLRALAGDVDAEREVCRRLLPAMHAFARRRLQRAAAEDFVHDALLLVIQALRERRVREAGSLASFALGICRNLARDRARSGERRQALMRQYEVSDADLVALDRPLEVRRGLLEDCFSQLTERARRVVRATFCEEAVDTEIAKTLALSEPNVRVIRHRALAALRACLEGPISWVQA